MVWPARTVEGLRAAARAFSNASLRRLEIDQMGLREAVDQVLLRNSALGFNTYGEQFCGVHVNQTLTAVALGYGRDG